MGIQVNVKLKDLPEDWTQEIRITQEVRRDCGIYDGHCDYCQGGGCYEDVENLYVHFPKSGWMHSYMTSALVFDIFNKNINFQFTEELDQNKIPYKRG